MIDEFGCENMLFNNIYVRLIIFNDIYARLVIYYVLFILIFNNNIEIIINNLIIWY